MSPLQDPAFNLRVGQDYFTWLLEKGVGHDLVRAVAAYNAGPAPVARTAQMLGPETDEAAADGMPAGAGNTGLRAARVGWLLDLSKDVGPGLAQP